MKEVSAMSKPMNCAATTNATSSRESADGRSRSDSLDGLMTNLSGLEAVHVSRFRAVDSQKAMPTNDTSGPLFTRSSPSASLQRSLENRLRAKTDVNGSLEYVLTWREQDMPSGLPICALRASARPKSANGFIGYPTVRAADRGPRNPVTAQKKLTSDGRTRHHRIEDLLTALGTRIGYPNPRFLSWMMGFPESWTSFGVTAMQSCRKSGRCSSKQRATDCANNERSEGRTNE
jgi:hypothetical protein